MWRGYGVLYNSNEIDENGQFCPGDSGDLALAKTVLPFQRQPPATSVSMHRTTPPPLPPPGLPPPPPLSGPTIGELVLAAEVRALEKQVKDLTLDKNHAERVLHALVDYHVHKNTRRS